MPGIHRNYFESLACYADSKSTFGANNIRHVGNIFNNIIIYNSTPSTLLTTVHEDASNTIIVGGTLSDQGFVDYGIDTKTIRAPNIDRVTSNIVSKKGLYSDYALYQRRSTQIYQN